MRTDDWYEWMVEAMTSVLRKKLGREPTEAEIVAKLPLIMCRHEHP